MTIKNKKGVEFAEYPKMLKIVNGNETKKVIVQNKEEEDKVLAAANKPAGKW